MPNWNSCTIPVATPRAKEISISFPQNRVDRSQCSSPVRYQRVWKIATQSANPIVTGTKMKW
jgi:hypothetical protein